MNGINSLNTLSAKTGIGGLMSGMDIDELVKGFTIRSREKILKQQQAVQMLTWKQSAYRTVTKALTEFHSSYLDLLSATNFRSTSLFNTAIASFTSSAVNVTPTKTAAEGSITIDYISQLAEKQIISSGFAVSRGLSGIITEHGPMSSEDISDLISSISGKSISLTLDGRLKTVSFDNSFIQTVGSNLSETGFENALRTAIDKAFGVIDNKDRIIDVSLVNGRLTLSADGSLLTVRAVGDDEETLGTLGFQNEQSNRLSLYSSLEETSLSAKLDDVDTFKFSINSVAFEFEKDKALSDIMKEIEASNAGVTLTYSSLSDTFIFTAKETGAGDNIIIAEEQGNLLSSLGLTAESDAHLKYGKNAILSVNNKEIVRSSNNITVDGVNIELFREITSDESVIITLKQDASSLLDPIKKFIEDYNSILDLINGLVSEKSDLKYLPLSEEQKSEMTEKQIEQWEEKSRAGILRNDPLLRNLLSGLRSAMLGGAKKGGINLFDLGITTGGYQDYGKLKIDNEAKFAEALKTRGNEIAELFTNAENGLANKLNDIIQGAVKRTGPKNQRGTLIDLAGIESSSSDMENSIFDAIKNKNKRIEELQARLTAEETRHWRKFTAMEAALQRLDIQGAMLMQFYNN